MDESRKTLAFVATAILVTVLAFLTVPVDPTPEIFSDQGEKFFPDFDDPNAAASLEIIDFDDITGRINAFKVVFRGTTWRIPSHHNYPADDKDRLARTAAGIIDVRKDDVVAEIAIHHESLGVVDPLDESIASLAGRGKRLTIKDGNNNLLADLIVGKNVPGREGRYRYIRAPGQKRTYAARFETDVSSRFSDWIDKDLLGVKRNLIEQVTLKNYSIDEGTRILDQRDTIVLTRGDPSWIANRMLSGQKVNEAKMEDLLKALEELTIVGVRPKPVGLSRSLRDNDEGISVNHEALLSLQEKGYYFTSDGQLVSNEGEIQVRTKDGVVYTLRFGEIVYGAGDLLTAGANASESGSPGGPGENRYLFITTDFNSDMFPEPRKPTNTEFLARVDSLRTGTDHANAELHKKHEVWKNNVAIGRRISADLNGRFAQWYYVISADNFDRIHLRRSALVNSQ